MLIYYENNNSRYTVPVKKMQLNSLSMKRLILQVNVE